MRLSFMRKVLALTFGTLALLAVAGGLLGKARASVQTATTMRTASLVLDWYPNSDHGGIYTAIDRGFLGHRHINLQVRVPSDTSAQIKLVAAGQADFGVTYETDLLAAQLQHIPVRSVMCIMQHPLNTLMTLKSSHINRPRQLVGHTVGGAGVPSDQVIVKAMLSDDHADADRVTFVNVGYNLLPALLSGRVTGIVGGYWNWEAIKAQQQGQPVNVMRIERWGVPNYCELVLITNTHTVSADPTLVGAVVQGLQQGYAYAESHPAVAWNALHREDKTLDHGLVLRSLQLLKPVITDASTIGKQNGSQWRLYARWLSSHKLISGNVNVTQAFTNSFLKNGVR